MHQDVLLSLSLGVRLPPPPETHAARPQLDDDLSQALPLTQCLSFDRHTRLSPAIVCHFCTCNGSIRRNAFVAADGFDERFQGNSYGDDYDLALRLHTLGYRLAFDPSPWLIHLQAPIGGLRIADPLNPFSYKDRAISRCLFLLRHGRPPWLWYLLASAVRTTVLTRSNIHHPGKLLAAAAGFLIAMVEALILLQLRLPSQTWLESQSAKHDRD